MRVFVGSCSEARPLADWLCEAMRLCGLDPLPWWDCFPVGAYTMEALINAAGKVDAAVLIWSKDDTVETRGVQIHQPRPNLLVEYGLFVAALGREKTFIIQDEQAAAPSDSLGITTAKYRLEIIPAESGTLNRSEFAKASRLVLDQLASLATFGSAFTISPGGTVLALGTHWDDLLLGALGTLIKLKDRLHYNVHVYNFCNTYDDVYYGERQSDLGRCAENIWAAICHHCDFEFIRSDRRLHLVTDRNVSNSQNSLRQIMERTLENRDSNLILCPPVDDDYDDHSVVGRAAFAQYRKQQLLEYPIKAFTQRNAFHPSVCVPLDRGIVEKRDTCVTRIAAFLFQSDINFIKGASRLFMTEAINARSRMAAINHTKDKTVEHAEVFRGRIEV